MLPQPKKGLWLNVFLNEKVSAASRIATNRRATHTDLFVITIDDNVDTNTFKPAQRLGET